MRSRHGISLVALVGLLVAGTPATAGRKLNVAVLLYENALLLDFGIAAEMFLAADFMRSFQVYTVAREREVPVSILGHCSVDYGLENAPKADLVIVPGGPSWQQAATDTDIVRYLTEARAGGATLFSVCTGALLLAKAGLLSHHSATTNAQALAALAAQDSSIHVVENVKFVDAGDVVTTAGAGSAIEGTLYVIGKLAGAAVATDLAHRYLDYPYEVEPALEKPR